MNIYQWEQAIMDRLEGLDPVNYDIEIKTIDAGLYHIIPPGRELDPDNDHNKQVSKGWIFSVEGSGRFEEYPTLRELLEDCLNEEWISIIWPKEKEVGSRLRLPARLHKRFKIKLINDGLSIQEFYRRAVDRYLSEGEE